MSDASSYPLAWPEGWPRTDHTKRSATNRFNTTFDRARRDLYNELRMLKATNVVISSWLPLKNNGEMRADQARHTIVDPGVAVYFTMRGRQMVLARDAFNTVHDNLRSIGLSLAGLRQMERHGGAHMMERAFEGFMAIEYNDWRKVLGYRPGERPDKAQLTKQWISLAKQRHPDAGGSDGQMSELNVALAAAKKELFGE